MRSKILLFGFVLGFFNQSCRSDSDKIDANASTLKTDTSHVKGKSDNGFSERALDITKLVSIDSVGKEIVLPMKIKDDTYESSFDGKIHLSIDSLIHFDYADTAYAVLIVYNNRYVYENNIADCHACAPLIEAWIYQMREQGKWDLIRPRGIQKQNGQWGTKGKAYVEYLGKDLPTLVLDAGEYSGQGYTAGVKQFYSLVKEDSFKKIFEYRYVSDSTGADEDGGESLITDMKWNSQDAYPQITLSTIDKISGKSTTQRFQYIDSSRIYEMPTL